MSTDNKHPLTRFSPSLWPALLANTRRIVTRHESGEECEVCPCYRPGRCARLGAARRLLADPEIVAAEQEAGRP
ncbi:hypothetical protein [Micromonospora sp. NPDC004704]